MPADSLEHHALRPHGQNSGQPAMARRREQPLDFRARRFGAFCRAFPFSAVLWAPTGNRGPLPPHKQGKHDSNSRNWQRAATATGLATAVADNRNAHPHRFSRAKSRRCPARLGRPDRLSLLTDPTKHTNANTTAWQPRGLLPAKNRRRTCESKEVGGERKI